MHIGKAGKWGAHADLHWADFSLALPRHVDELNVMADALRIKAARYAGQTIGGITVSGDVHNAVFQAEELEERPAHHTVALKNIVPPGNGPHGTTIESDNVTVLLHRICYPGRLRRSGLSDVACSSFTRPLLADEAGVGYFEETRGSMTETDIMKDLRTVHQEILAPLCVGTAAQLLTRLAYIDSQITEPAS